MRIPTPQEIGLPEKFDRWRPAQVELLEWLLTRKTRCKAVCAPTGFGKCFAARTPILLYDGRVANVEDIAVGDSLMGPDSSPRIVTSLSSGVDEMFEVIPTKGESYTVNSDHPLCLRLTPDGSNRAESDLVVPVSDYLLQSKTFRHRAKGYRVGVSFDNPSTLPLEPYFLGLWLGDGTQIQAAITTGDSQIHDYVRDFAGSWGMVVTSRTGRGCRTLSISRGKSGNRFRPNPVLSALREMGVTDYKFIPHSYKTSTTQARRQLLAGLLDADGSYTRCCYDYISVSRQLAHDVVFVARSLGLAAYVNPTEKSDQNGTVGLYYRVTISGDTAQLPLLIPRKQASVRRQKKNVLVTGIRIRAVGRGVYYGFTLSGPDRKFLLGDFTVAHNTPAYIAYALLTKQPTCFVTESRALQDQALADFESIGLVDLRGRSNYACGLRDGYSCEDGYAARCPMKGTINCPSSQAEMRAAVSPLVITNYAKWTHSRKFGQGMEHFTQVVFDEGDLSTDALERAMQVKLGAREVEETLGMDFPKGPDEFVNWKPWAAEARAESEDSMNTAREMLKTSHQPALIKHYLHMRNLSRRLAVISTANPINWVADETPTGHQFDPVRPGQYAESALLLRVPSIVFISATIRPKTMYMNGIPKNAFEFKEFDSDFDPARCPIYYVPTMRVDKRADSLAQLWVLLDQIAARRRDRKGIVHTISYARREEIRNFSRFADSMIVNPQGEAPTEIIDLFKRSEPGAILVSPSVGAGFDFPMKDCEWQFVCKIPFQPGQSKIIKARQEADKEYGATRAMRNLVQAFGRGPRSKQDRCEGFIGDEHIDWFLPRFGHLAPKSFHRFFKRVSVLPQPPPKL